MSRSLTPAGAVVKGLLAGAIGTAAMDLVMYLRYRKDGGEQTFVEWESSAGLDDWEQAAAPAQLGKRIFESFFQRELSAEWARTTNNVMHWSYGSMAGAQYAIAAGSVSAPWIRSGIVLGTTVWGSSYVVLPAAKLYKPIWKYDTATLAKDLSAHLAYGLTAAAAFRVLAGNRNQGG